MTAVAPGASPASKENSALKCQSTKITKWKTRKDLLPIPRGKAVTTMVRILVLEHSPKRKSSETKKFLESEATPSGNSRFHHAKVRRDSTSRNRQLKISTVTSVQNYWFGILKGSKDLSLPYSCTLEIFLVFQFLEVNYSNS